MRCSRIAFPLAVVAAAGLLSAVTACSVKGALAPPVPGAAKSAVHRLGASPIQHVVYIFQENRSFDDLFQGYPGANTVSQGLNSQGQEIPLTAIPFTAPYDVNHGVQAYVSAYDNSKMDGFDLEGTVGSTSGYPNPEYGFVPAAEIGPYLALARQYVLNDTTFSSQLDASFAAHQYIIAGQAASAANLPTGGPYWGCDGSGEQVSTLTQSRQLGAGEPPCFDYMTLADELNAAQPALSWRFYAASVATMSPGFIWSSYDAVSHIRYGSQWATNVISPSLQVIADVKAGTLANVTWITPTIANSDHSGSQSANGPNWVTAVVNAIGTSQFWNSTVIFVIWDDWGGWYDHVPPPQLDYDGLGMRVPLLIVSPYAPRGVVSHVQYETASLLKFAEDNWGLAPLSASDARAADPIADLNYAQNPRLFKRIRRVAGASEVLRKPAGRDFVHADGD
jgi:phospholipase C